MRYKIISKVLLFTLLLNSSIITSQTVNELINEVNTNNLNLTLNEFSGEVSTTVNGNNVAIKNRVSQLGNNLAADYLKQKLNSFGNLEVVENNYSSTGRNIIATQTGLTNPNNVYIISAHYDSVANYSADDNATGTAAVLETARILSGYCTENTIIYALWDEEEEGLIGSKNYAADARLKNKNILGVINLDMIGYDKDKNNNIPIHTKNVANSLVLKDDILTILNSHKNIGLTPNVVNGVVIENIFLTTDDILGNSFTFDVAGYVPNSGWTNLSIIGPGTNATLSRAAGTYSAGTFTQWRWTTGITGININDGGTYTITWT